MLLLAVLLLLQPAVHLAGFADLGVQGLLAMALVGAAAPRERGIGLELGIAIAGCAGFLVYGPWIVWMLGVGPHAALAVHIAALVAVVIGGQALRGRLLPLAARAGATRWLAWSVPLVLIACTVIVALTFFGSQLGVRLLRSNRWGTALLAGEALLAALALPALPPIIAECAAGRPARALLEGVFGGRWRAAAVLLANAALLLLARAAIAPEAFTSSGRPDLLIPLLPAMLAPLVLLVVATAEPSFRLWGRLVVASTVTVVIAFAFAAPSAGFAAAEAYFLPPSEMRALVDWVAAQPGVGADGQVDMAYALGREPLMRIACSPMTSWYTTSRPFDWLLLRRHGLHDRREGWCARSDDGRFLVTYGADPPPRGRVLRLTLPHLAVWE
jgi:hypothetical protein